MSSEAITRNDLKNILDEVLPIRHKDVTKIEYTPLRGSPYASFGGCYYKKYKNVVHFHVGLSGLTAGTGNVIFNLPSDINPNEAMGFSCLGSTSLAIGSVQISATGAVTVYLPSGSTLCLADLTWFI